MEHSKKAIGFFVSLAFLVLGYFSFATKQIEPFADFALLEWQMKLAGQGIFHLPYQHLLEDPEFLFFPLPEIFFHIHNGLVYSTFPNLYPILFSPFYLGFGIMGVKLAQILLFFLSIYLFHLIQKDDISTILLLFGSSISIYIFLIHETIFFFFLEIIILYFYHRKWSILSGVLSICLVWMRPEMIFAIFFLPFCFPKEWEWKRFVGACVITGALFAIINQITLGTFLPLRVLKNSAFQFRPELSLYLLKIWIEQVPIFVLFVFYLGKSIVRKEFLFRNLFLISLTIAIMIISPNTGGHNTPRYLFGLIPLYALTFRYKEKNKEGTPKIWILVCLIISFYQINVIFQQTKELKKISKFQTNTIQELKTVDDSILVFNNSDFAFVALPLLEQKKDLLLLRSDYPKETFFRILDSKNTKSFSFLELPPSPFSLGETLSLSNCKKDCEFQKNATWQLPAALLPITTTSYQRK
ncbi:LA_3751/LA_3752 family putative glycosyltransferase [Leptospira brenneri]|uniref:LA_3751/LA_3752 family putative glycosyltransferase n=1 Tax=Leptospira brenneri TaxID=2023182 RepID=UPI000C2AB403|nr:hypothetical protein [Leptospira brenneri]PJZ44525.1 hypothetical protein CH361_15630 [Leptospira brenneri]